MRYRAEIDGLRAVSVLMVVFFHFGFDWMPGGFVGVDVFFVISGYLITTLLIGAGAEPIGFADFYTRRIKRLAPALVTLLLLCTVAGYFILSPGDYRVLAASGLSTLLAGSNFYFLFNTGYFDPSAQTMPLLHTWSLGVEEQFYLIWPLALLVLRKTCGGSRALIIGAVAILALISFALDVHAVTTQGQSGFYLPQDRAWQLLAGALVALMPNLRLSRAVSEMMAALGLAAIIGAGWGLTKSDPYPGFYGLIPVVGTVAFIVPTRNAVIQRLLAMRVPVLIGQASYSIYLYHWPVLVFWRHYTGGAPLTLEQSLSLIFFSCALGIVSWRLVEQPLRRARLPKLRVATVFIGAEALLGGVLAVVMLQNGLPDRLSPSVRAMRSLDVMWQWQCPREQNGYCEAGRPWASAAHRIFMFGDSNMQHFMPLMTIAAAGHDVSIRAVGGCSPIIDGVRIKGYVPNQPDYSDMCHTLYEKYFSEVGEGPAADVLIFASAWSSVATILVPSYGEPAQQARALQLFAQGVDNLYGDFKKRGRHIVVLSDMPRWGIDPIPCVLSQETNLLRRRCSDDMGRLTWTAFNNYQRAVHDLLRRYNGKDDVLVISPEDYLCDSAGCRTTINGEFIYRDEGHLRRNLRAETQRQLATLLHFNDIVALAESGEETSAKSQPDETALPTTSPPSALSVPSATGSASRP